MANGGATLQWRVDQLKRRLEVEREVDLSWKQIAEEAGLNYTVVLRISKGQTGRADLETLLKLSEYFQVPIDDLFEKVPA